MATHIDNTMSYFFNFLLMFLGLNLYVLLVFVYFLIGPIFIYILFIHTFYF